MINIGYKFYNQYFNSLSFNVNNGKPVFDGQNTFKDLKRYSLNNYLSYTKYFINDYIKSNNTLVLCTTYPGLLVGSGYIHEIGGKTAENELKLGFFFDHTTGLPVIPSSSVKGLLRSAFKLALETSEDQKHKASLYVQEILESITNTKWSFEDINKLEKNIFIGKDVSIYKRDIFFDAFPSSSANKNSVIFSNDYITNHENPLKNPNPVQFLKILPQVTFQFNFKLEDSDLLSTKNKKELFKQILLDLGIGAKTNVGYGQFVDEAESNYKDTPLNLDKTELIENDILKAKITSLQNGICIDFGFKLDFTPKIIGVSPKTFKVDQIIEIKVVKKGNRLNFNIINSSK